MSFKNDNNAVEEEVRYDPEYGPFASMEDAEKKGMVGTEFCIGEMPLEFDNLPDEMICKNTHTGKIERVDGSDSAIYIGREPTRRRSYRAALMRSSM